MVERLSVVVIGLCVAMLAGETVNFIGHILFCFVSQANIMKKNANFVHSVHVPFFVAEACHHVRTVRCRELPCVSWNETRAQG